MRDCCGSYDVGCLARSLCTSCVSVGYIARLRNFKLHRRTIVDLSGTTTVKSRVSPGAFERQFCSKTSNRFLLISRRRRRSRVLDMSPEPLSIISPLRPNNSTCGYCSPPGERSATKSSYHAAECMPQQLSCRVTSHIARPASSSLS